MLLPVLSLAATLWAAVTPAPPSATTTAMASTYDEAACASLHADEDDWARSAIGELIELGPVETDCLETSIAPLPSRATLAKLDCDEPAAWAMIGTCALPHTSKLPGAHLRAASDHSQRRAFRLLAANDSTPPLAPPPTSHDFAPLHPSTPPALVAPAPRAHLAHWIAPRLRSIAYDTLLRPPAA
jgi:hypothetical protein